MTGDWASWGRNCQQGTYLALAELKKHATSPVLDLILEDSPNAKAVNALTAFRKLAHADRVRFILGPMSPEEYAAIAPLADQSGIPLLPFVSSRILIPAAMFMWMDPESEARQIADYVAARHRSVAVLSSNQEWESLVGRVFKERLLEKRSAIALFEEPPFDAPDVRMEIARLKKRKVDSIFVTSYLLFSKYLKGIQAATIKAPIYGIEIDASAAAAAGTAAEGLVFIRPAAPDEKFKKAFHAAWGADPDIPASQCYDSIMVLNRAILSGVRDKASFIMHLKSFRPYHGASGTIMIDKGKTVMSTDLFRVINGAITRLEAVDHKEKAILPDARSLE